MCCDHLLKMLIKLYIQWIFKHFKKPLIEKTILKVCQNKCVDGTINAFNENMQVL